MFFRKVDCSESVEDALARLDRESKQKKLEKQLKEEKEKIEKAKKTTERDRDRKVYDDPMSQEQDNQRDFSYPMNDKARHLYPERGGEAHKSGWLSVVFKGEGREGLDKLKCEMNVWKVIQKSKFLSLAHVKWKIKCFQSIKFLCVI